MNIYFKKLVKLVKLHNLQYFKDDKNAFYDDLLSNLNKNEHELLSLYINEIIHLEASSLSYIWEQCEPEIYFGDSSEIKSFLKEIIQRI